jgi:hypothetical protein
MSVFAAFLATILMSTFGQTAPQCKHGAHMHVIWQCIDGGGGRHGLDRVRF